MNKRLRLLLAFFFWVTICGCTKEDDSPIVPNDLHDVVFHAGWAPETKTVLQEDGSVWWSPGDEISLFVGGGDNGGYKLTSTNTAPAAKVDFMGQIGDNPNNAPYTAIYPYNVSNRIEGSQVVVTIPVEQVAKEGTFANGALISIAVSSDENLYFKNVCSGIKFSVSTPGIKKIVITNKDNSTFSGEIQYNLENGIISSGSTNTSVTVIAPKETGFETGKYYYAAVYPTVVSSGVDISYYTENTFGKYSYNNPVEFKRGVLKRAYEKDKDIAFYPYHENSAKLYVSNLLPYDVDKTKITDVSFIVNSDKTTDISLPHLRDGEPPIYFELDGTTAKYYTKAEIYEIVEARGMFANWTSLKNIDLTNIETTNVTDMGCMFGACISLKSIKFGKYFYTGNVETMDAMFGDCWSIESLDMSGFITNNVKNMRGMFGGCSSLKALDLSSFNTSSVEYMSCMFGPVGMAENPIRNGSLEGCSSLESLDLHTFNTAKVKQMFSLFQNCSRLKTVNLSGWNTSNVEDLGAFFMGCTSLESVDLSSFDTRNVTSMGFMFSNCVRLKSLDLSNFNTCKVTRMDNMFFRCESLRSLDIHNFDASSLTDALHLLSDNVQLRRLDLGSFDISKVTNIYEAFGSVAFKSKAVAIRCVDATKQVIEGLADGTYFNLDHVTWVGIDEAIPDLPDVIDPNMYYSKDFSMDKKVKILQTASHGKGVDIVIMGDAYSDRLIADGTYESDMREAINAIFEVEPMKTYKNLFNVYMVYAVSENEVRDGSTAFGIYTELGNNVTCNAYTKVAVQNKSLSDIATIVIGRDLNAFEGVGGVVWSSWVWDSEDTTNDYGQAQQSIAFIGRCLEAEYTGTVVHEFGHLFPKLADEYVAKDEAIGTSDEYEIQDLIVFCSSTGAYKNIDLTSDPETIKWSHFLKDSRYANEKLGAYEGGHLYSKGVWRPTQESIMRNVLWTHGFNAPSREAIYYRIHKLAYGEDWQYDYETFVQQDLKNIPSEPYFQSVVQNTPYPARVNKKHIFKMKKSIAPDGKKMITVIMD